MTSDTKSAKTRILETANRLVYTKGFNQTSFADIAEQLGLSKGNLHYHYRSKDELLDAIVEYRLQHIRQQLEQWNEKYPDPRGRLRRFVTMIAGSEADLVRYGCPLGSLNAELGKYQPDLQQQARRMFDEYREWLVQVFRQAGQKNCVALANHLLSMAQGAALMSYVYADKKILRKECSVIHEWIDSLTQE